MRTCESCCFDAAGPVFCAGADLKERQGKDEAWVRQRRLASFAAYEAIERCSKPVVAIVQGPAIGSGGEIAMACDFIVASDFVTFRFPEPQWGTVGATQRLQRVIGKRRAKELLFTGRTMPVEEAYALGLVARVVPADELPASAEAIAAHDRQGSATRDDAYQTSGRSRGGGRAHDRHPHRIVSTSSAALPTASGVAASKASRAMSEAARS